MSINSSNISKLFRTLVNLPERVNMAPTTAVPSLRPPVAGYDDPELEPASESEGGGGDDGGE